MWPHFLTPSPPPMSKQNPFVTRTWKFRPPPPTTFPSSFMHLWLFLTNAEPGNRLGIQRRATEGRRIADVPAKVGRVIRPTTQTGRIDPESAKHDLEIGTAGIGLVIRSTGISFGRLQVGNCLVGLDETAVVRKSGFHFLQKSEKKKLVVLYIEVKSWMHSSWNALGGPWGFLVISGYGVLRVFEKFHAGDSWRILVN